MELAQLDLGDAPEQASEDIDGTIGCRTDGERAQGLQWLGRNGGGVPLL